MPIAAFPSNWSAESVIPPACQQGLAAPLPAVLLPAARPRTASSGLSGTFAGCRGPVWSSWQPAGGAWLDDIQLFASVSLDRFDVWPGMVINHNCSFCIDIRVNKLNMLFRRLHNNIMSKQKVMCTFVIKALLETKPH